MCIRDRVKGGPPTLFDVRRIVTGLSENGKHGIALVEPSTRGQNPQYLAMRLTLAQCPNAAHFYKTGGMEAPLDCGHIVVAEENKEGVIVDDFVKGQKWGPQPGFPGAELRQATFASEHTTLLTPICTGPRLTRTAFRFPYEMEMSGFLDALSRHGVFNERNQIGCVGVVTDNFHNTDLAKKPPVACMEDLASFWRNFLENLH